MQAGQRIAQGDFLQLRVGCRKLQVQAPQFLAPIQKTEQHNQRTCQYFPHQPVVEFRRILHRKPTVHDLLPFRGFQRIDQFLENRMQLWLVIACCHTEWPVIEQASADLDVGNPFPLDQVADARHAADVAK